MRFIDFKDSYNTEQNCKDSFRTHRNQQGIICKKC
jgi:hypothetical protein